MKRKISVLIVVLMLLSALCACTKPAVETPNAGGLDYGSEDDVYYMVTFISTIEFWDECYRGFKEAATVFGAKTEYTGAKEVDVNEQITVLEQVIAMKPAGIAVTCADAQALAGTIDKALEQGIYTICFDSDSPTSNRDTILATGNENAGKQLAYKMADALGGEGEVALIFGAGTTTYEARAAGIRDGLAEFPGIKIVTEGNYNGEQEDAARATAAILQANPELDGIFGVNSPGGLGAATAIREAGKSGEVHVCCFDHDDALYEAIKDGSVLATARQGAYNMGFWSLNFLFYVRNNMVNTVEGWKESGLSPLPASVDTGVDIVTKDNLSAFYQG